MEEKPKRQCSCRLAVNNESGRVQWCVGKQNVWSNLLKRLVFVPIVLLTVALVIYLITKAGVSAEIIIQENDLYEAEILEEKRDILHGVKTEYIPNYGFISKNDSIKRKRRFSETDIDEVLITYNVPEEMSWKTPYDKKTERPFFFKHQIKKGEIRKLQSGIMKKLMNLDINPCEDFYGYACGNWDNHFEIPPDRAAYDTFEMVRENVDYVIKEILDDVEVPSITQDFDKKYKNKIEDYIFHDEEPYVPTSAVVKAKYLYESCMNQDAIEERREEPLLKMIRHLGGWPIIDENWDESSFDLISLLGRLRLLNNDVLISEWIGLDMKNSNEYIIHIDQPSLGLPSREYFIDPAFSKYLEAYKKFIQDIALLLTDTDIILENYVEEIVQFEIDLASIMSSNEARKNILNLYLRTDIQTLPLYYAEFDWEKYFQMVLGKKITPVYPVAVYCSEYLQKLVYIISITPPRILQNYVLWRFIKNRASNLDGRFSAAKQKFYQVLFGKEKDPPRWTFCVSQVNGKMGMAVGSLFVKKYFDKNSRNDTTEMTEFLETAFRNILLENTWLDDETKQYAHMKINEMDLKIGFPDFILNDKELSNNYNDVIIHPEYFFENTLIILRHLTRFDEQKVGNVVNKTHWVTYPAVVNAYYSRNKNQILFPAGMLQPPFYHRHFPKALNFGGIGVVIGHEITHGFDDKGRLYDHQGNIHLWWGDDAIKNFYEKAECLVKQYGKYILPEVNLPIDGYLTQGENIADNGGLKQAFRAYKTWLDENLEHTEDEFLPEMSLNGEQLFFLNFAQVWCGRQRYETAKSRIKTSVHAPGIFRVIGPISNSEDFAKAFNCPLNSTMNPQNKCIIW
ncbi:unnamed protein product [Brassicogethes aeneus]|uniref:Uncharacterized protein n=1 Tax=Brassicogethes aeneus TaxID=1431903 RepID=A0A9P0FPH2_BRAAE|nr:unnamed protein product [Brassicogethes aeneus]